MKISFVYFQWKISHVPIFEVHHAYFTRFPKQNLFNTTIKWKRSNHDNKSHAQYEALFSLSISIYGNANQQHQMPFRICSLYRRKHRKMSHTIKETRFSLADQKLNKFYINLIHLFEPKPHRFVVKVVRVGSCYPLSLPRGMKWRRERNLIVSHWQLWYANIVRIYVSNINSIGFIFIILHTQYIFFNFWFLAWVYRSRSTTKYYEITPEKSLEYFIYLFDPLILKIAIFNLVFKFFI